MFNAGNFQISHDHFTVLIVLAQGFVLLIQVRKGAQFVLCSGAHCKKDRADISTMS